MSMKAGVVTTKDAALHRAPGQPGDVAVELRHVDVRYGATVALSDCSLQVRRGETLALLGPSGSGKSTALKAIAGFERPSSGQVVLEGRDITALSPAQRGIGVVVQNYALFPHLKVSDNVAFGLRAQKWKKADIQPRVMEALRMVSMETYAGRYPRELSGGQQQRVAIARALASRPDVLLLDEPLSALDAHLRQEMIGELQVLHAELPNVAIVHVTHDQAEALALADRIGLMRNGRLVDIGSTDELYNRPPSEFAATFLGGSTVLPVQVLDDADTDARVRVRHGEAVLLATALTPVAAGQNRMLSVRPWSWRLGRDLTGVDAGLAGTVQTMQWRGATHRLRVLLDTGISADVDLPSDGPTPALGERVQLSVQPVSALVLAEAESL